MWVFLKENYYADTSFSFVHQMQKIFSIQNSFNPTHHIAEFIRAFEQEWSRLLLLSSTSGSSPGSSKYRMLMKQVLQQDEAKRDWLLAALVSITPIWSIIWPPRITSPSRWDCTHCPQTWIVVQEQLLLSVMGIMGRSETLIAAIAHQTPPTPHQHLDNHAPGAKHETSGMRGMSGRSVGSWKLPKPALRLRK